MARNENQNRHKDKGVCFDISSFQMTRFTISMPCGLRTNLGLGLWKGWVLQLKGEQLKGDFQPQKRLHLTQFKWFAIASIAPALEKLNGGWSQSDPESGEYRCPSYLFLFGVARSIYSRTCSVKVELVN